jgi:hypothetical protein
MLFASLCVAPGFSRQKENSSSVARFSEAIQSIATARKAVVIAEGVPCKGVLSPKEAAKHSRERASLPLGEWTVRLASAFDYDVEAREGVVLLSKRYTSTYDLPDISLEECRHSLEEMRRLIAPFSPQLSYLDHEDAALTVPAALTPEQLTRLKDQCLTVAELPESTRAKIRRVGRSIFLTQTEDRLETTLRYLSWIQQPKSVLYREENGLAIRSAKAGVRQSEKLSLRPRIGTVSATNGSEGGVMEALPDLEDAAGSRTLAGLVSVFRSPPLTVQEALKTKRIYLAGEATRNPEAVLSGVAEIYGLRLARTEQVWHMGFSPPGRSAPLATLGRALQSTLPKPVLRLMPLSAVNAAVPVAAVSSSDPKQMELWAQAQKEKIEQTRFRREEPLRRRNAALRLLEEKFAQREKATGQAELVIPVTDLTPEERNLLANYFLWDILQDLRVPLAGAPDYLTRVETEVVLGGGIVDVQTMGYKMFRLSFYVQDTVRNRTRLRCSISVPLR